MSGAARGLLCEPLARLGAHVTGVDAAPENIAAAALHAEAGGLAIRYMAGELGALGEILGQHGAAHAHQYLALRLLDLGQFDLVTCLEVIEHVADKGAFVHQLAESLADDGLLILSTPNRTAKSRLLMVTAAESAGLIPRGTHDWDDFIAPDDLEQLLAAAGLQMGEPRGIAFSPTKGLHLSSDLALNYIVTARRA